MTDTGKRREAYGAYHFNVIVELDGVRDSFFRSCSGLKSEAEVQEVAEGGVNDTTHKLIGRTKFPNLVLKQGFSGPELWNARRRFLERNSLEPIQRITGTIIQLGPNKVEKKWRFLNGWICKWEGPDFDASKNEVSVETIEIAHEGLIYEE